MRGTLERFAVLLVLLTACDTAGTEEVHPLVGGWKGNAFVTAGSERATLIYNFVIETDGQGGCDVGVPFRPGTPSHTVRCTIYSENVEADTLTLRFVFENGSEDTFRGHFHKADSLIAGVIDVSVLRPMAGADTLFFKGEAFFAPVRRPK